ncbi:hypothetical protein V1L52_10385 [Treponema sp. HNW]|uniref:hypothetical protein n=1 Tax=Treponema sp. HNW TaxID=3116654 RepID=UPI003D1390F3
MKRFGLCAACLCLIVFSVFTSLTACSSRSSSGIFFEKLERIDLLIKNENYGAAWRLLKKNAKLTRSAADYLSIVRRAFVLDKPEFAEKELLKGLKRFPDNPELSAVYAHLLTASNRTEQALPYAAKLEGTKYGSLYTEIRFQKALADEQFQAADFLSLSFKQAYADAALTTGNSAYLRNAALVETFAGTAEAAFELHPRAMSVYDMPEFWARIAYHAEHFAQCIEDLRFAKQSDAVLMLASDALLRSGDEKGAASLWFLSTERFPLSNPAAWHNLSRSAFKAGNMGYAHLFLSSLVKNFPDYVPGLAAYARYALTAAPHTQEHIFSSVLHEKGIKTLSMELDELTPRILPEEALVLMEKSLERNKNAALVLEHLKLCWRLEEAHKRIDIIAGDPSRTADVWTMIEQNAPAPFEYDPLLVHFGLWYFCRYNMIAQAAELWEKRYALGREASEMTEAHTLEETDSLPEARFLREAWEYDIGSYIAFKYKDYEKAEALLNAAVKNGNLSMPHGALLNLAALYNGSGRRIEAAALYRRVLEAGTDKKMQADIYCKLALIQREQGERRSAVLSLKQAILLEPGHERARLMLKQMENQGY